MLPKFKEQQKHELKVGWTNSFPTPILNCFHWKKQINPTFLLVLLRKAFKTLSWGRDTLSRSKSAKKESIWTQKDISHKGRVGISWQWAISQLNSWTTWFLNRNWSYPSPDSDISQELNVIFPWAQRLIFKLLSAWDMISISVQAERHKLRCKFKWKMLCHYGKCRFMSD